MSVAGIFLLTGLPKSGTTWVMRMLDALPGVVCRGEGRFFASHLADVPSLRDSLAGGLDAWLRFLAHRKRNWMATDGDLTTVERRNTIPDDVLARVLEREIDRITGAAVSSLLHAVADRDPDARYVGDKTPLFTADELHDMRRALPSVPLVFLERDVRDYVVSMLFHHWRALGEGRADAGRDFLDAADAAIVECRVATGDGPLCSPETAGRLARAWAEVGRAARRLGAEDESALHLVSYEGLFEAPARELATICAYLGIEVEPAELELAVTANSRAAVRAGGDPALAQHVRSGVPGEWERWLDEDALAAIADAAPEALS